MQPIVVPLDASARLIRDSAPYDAVDAYIEQHMRRLNIPGIALAIVEGDQIVHLRGFGHACPGGAAPTPQTPFVLGSTTKSFTALAVMQLVEAGKIDLDAPVQRYLPWFRVADPQASAHMTVRHLLQQTSGLPGLLGMSLLADFDNSPSAAECQARALSTLVLSHPVGAAFEYSNLNYNLLGLIVEAASDESYSDYIQHHIFTPLGMRHSYTSQTLAKQNGLALGHRYWFAFPCAVHNLPIPRGSLPSGQLISSAEDMAHYLIAHLNAGRYGGAHILSGEGIDELHRGGVEARELGVSVGQYGMGWFITDIGQTKTVWHGGNVPDFSSYMALLPEQKKGVVLLVNADHYGLPPVLAEVGLGVTALLAGQQPTPIQLGFIPWTMRALLLIPLLQIAGVIMTLRRVRRWRRNAAVRPSRGRLWAVHILPPLIPNLLVALTLLPMLGKMRGYLRLFNPDVSWVALICGSFAGIWIFLRTGLILQALRKPRASKTLMENTNHE
jgi:CubicO group peptidase (beta-lactamase class C family)